MRNDNIEYCLFMIIGVIIYLGVSTFVFRWAWNTFVPKVWEDAYILNFWESLAAVVLINIIGSMFRK